MLEKEARGDDETEELDKTNASSSTDDSDTDLRSALCGASGDTRSACAPGRGDAGSNSAVRIRRAACL